MHHMQELLSPGFLLAGNAAQQAEAGDMQAGEPGDGVEEDMQVNEDDNVFTKVRALRVW